MTWPEAFAAVGITLAVAFAFAWDGRLPWTKGDDR